MTVGTRVQGRPRVLSLVPFVLGLGGLLLAAGCGRGEGEQRAPVLLVGVDGFEWSVALPLVRAGRMPHLAGLMERGTFGLLETMDPTSSPVVWTTIATGKLPDEHGIHGFVVPRTSAEEPHRLYSNADRRTKALWNIASDAGLRVAVIGWWLTFPVEPVEGVMVAQTNTMEEASRRGIWKGGLLRGVPGQVHPASLEARVWQVLGEIEAGLPELERRIFGAFRQPPEGLAARLWENCRWAFRADAVYASLALELLADQSFDLLAVYLGGPDVVGHRFWRWHEPELFTDRPPPEEVRELGELIDRYYVYVDELLGRLVAAAPEEARVLVVSDHGMVPIQTDRVFHDGLPTSQANSAHHLDAPPGIVAAAGPGLARRGAPLDLSSLSAGDLRTIARVLDVAPTVLALLGLPAGEDMPGVVAAGMLDPAGPAAHPRPRVPTHDTPGWAAAHAALRRADPGEAERLEQLRGLGYVGDD